MNRRTCSLIRIHIAVLLFGIAGLLGKLITLGALYIVTGRTLFASLTLFAIVSLTGNRHIRNPGMIPAVAGLGALLGVHWYAFFHSIRLSTVTIGLLTFSSFPLFTALLEPIVCRTKVERHDLIVACMVTIGLVLVVPEYDFGNRITLGAVWGVLAGLSFAILQIMNRLLLKDFSALQLSLGENVFAFFLLLLFGGGAAPVGMPVEDILMLVFLGVVCTALAHTIFIRGLKDVKAQVASIIASLEPVYGILLAVLLLSERPDFRTIFGGSIILLSVIAASRKPVSA